ncbi:hypothetical protein SARC_08952 [Sphaeroforma arctica JP610]|uniref:Secreted protein n=1 Tax=Sphaeroforma arctica JP610 TaxID=667725 RepID=A0A0L0FPA3_9EUKA|nr:hypothetical protein SARC_08952 [Sphaeroforma arctica JP610]KNC78622.1 hypothetical protein SARC_08952 [Sphaeroforma arctica JP610]|eukprot:XP_014152524.1 hypothetical protein SARC_08952 [Sphaeroforma arctica JP610]
MCLCLLTTVAVSKAVCPTLCDALLVRDRDDVKKYLQCSDPTPWFNNTFRRAFFNCLRGSPHETFDHPVAILMIVASSDPDPVHFLQNSYNPGMRGARRA